MEDEDVDLSEAGFAKAKRARAIKATKDLKHKLCAVESATHTVRSSMMEVMMFFREENERKAELRREEEDRRRRDESEARGARMAVEKAEADECRRQDKVDMEERTRRDKEEAHARTQELIVLVGALSKKE